MDIPQKYVRLVSYTKGVPYLRDSLDTSTGQAVFQELIEQALHTSQGLTAWWAQKDAVVALWASWFAPHVGGGGALEGITPLVYGYLNDDPRQVAYELEYGGASIVVSWFKHIGRPHDAATVGMAGIKVSSPGGASRFLGLIPEVADAAELGADLYAGTLAWDSFAGPLARYIMGNLVVLGRRWTASLGANGPIADDLTAALEDETAKALQAEGRPTSRSNLNQVVGEGPGKVPVAGETATDPAAVQKVAGSSATMLEADGAERAIAVEAAEAAPGIDGLVAFALFTCVPSYLRGRLQYIDLRVEVVNSLNEDVQWSCWMGNDGVILQLPSDATIPAMQPLRMATETGTREVLTSHAAQLEVQNDPKGNNPLALFLDLTVGGRALGAVITIDTKNGSEDLGAWVGERSAETTQQRQLSYRTPDGVTIAVNVTADPRETWPPPRGATVATYSALIHLSRD